MKTILVNTTTFYSKNNIRLYERHLFKKYNGMFSLKMVFASQAHIIFRIIKGACSNSNTNIYLNKQCISLSEPQTLAALTAYPGLEQDSFFNVFRRTLHQDTLMCFIKANIVCIIKGTCTDYNSFRTQFRRNFCVFLGLLNDVTQST